jgi:hypothetical protein
VIETYWSLAAMFLLRKLSTGTMTLLLLKLELRYWRVGAVEGPVGNTGMLLSLSRSATLISPPAAAKIRYRPQGSTGINPKFASGG